MYLILFRAFLIFSSLPWEKIKKKIARINENIHHAAISITIAANINSIISDTVFGPYVDVIMKLIFYYKDLVNLCIFYRSLFSRSFFSRSLFNRSLCCFWSWCFCLLFFLCCFSFSFCCFFFCFCSLFFFYSFIVDF